MVRGTIPVDVSHQPELLAFAEQVKRSGARYELRTDGEVLATVAPATARRGRRGKRTSAADPIWQIAGMARSSGPSDVSAHADDYLAETEISASRP